MKANHKTKNRIGAIFLLITVSTGYCSSDPRVQTVGLNPLVVTQIPIGMGHVTTVLFPRPVTSIVGYGMTSDPGSEDGWIQLGHPADSGMLTLRVLKPDLKIAYMTVLVGDDVYNFELDNSPDNAALSIKLTEAGNSQEPTADVATNASVASSKDSSPPVELDKEAVIDARPVYHPEKLQSLLQLAKDATLLRESSPELYRGYEERKVSNASDYGDVVATVEEIHRFPVDDAILLFGEIQNKGAKAVTFDPVAITIGIVDRQYPSAFVDCVGTINPGETVKFAVIGQGDIDGGRAHLALRNTFRILLPQFKKEEASPPAPAATAPKTGTAPRHVHHASWDTKQIVEPKQTATPMRFQWPWQKAKQALPVQATQPKGNQ
jgi:hypothetical protein